MAFGAGELRVLRRALALALHPSSATVQDVQDCHRLAESVDDAARESARFRAFLLADLTRYRAALPGTVSGYLTLLSDALDAGYRPGPDDFAALGALRGSPAAAAMLVRCGAVTGETTRRGADRAPLPAARAEHVPAAPAAPAATREGPSGVPRPAAPVPPALPALTVVPSSRRRLLALPGGLAADAPGAAASPEPPKPSEPPEPGEPSGTPETESKPEGAPAPTSEPERAPEDEPAPEPAEPEQEPDRRPAAPSEPGRPVPTPAEVFPPKRRPAPPANPRQELAAG
jgi:hypothetical protein